MALESPEHVEAKQGETDINLPAEKAPSSKVALAKQIAEDFQDWYAVYPKHVGRGAAVNSYNRARKNGATADELLAGAKRYLAERKGQDPQFTKAPATWLNQECWTDEPTANLSPWDPAYHHQGKATIEDKMRGTVAAGQRLQAQIGTVPRQYQWCNPPREIETPEEESA